MKRAIILFWKGLTGIISATAEWFTVILGMKDESKYGKFIRRVVGGCFATHFLCFNFRFYSVLSRSNVMKMYSPFVVVDFTTQPS